MAEGQALRRCRLCGGLQSRGETTFTVDLGQALVVVRHVPAWVCDQCGASFIDDGIAAKLEEMVERARSSGAEVEILSAAHLTA